MVFMKMKKLIGRVVLFITVSVAVVMLWACSSRSGPAASVDSSSRAEASLLARPTMHDDSPRDYAGLHNVVAFSDSVFSGSVPEGEAGFKTLRDLGVRTVISVDGAVPEVELAGAYGMRYVHLPISYNGIDESRKLEITRALRDLPHPVYIHCHHGKHRSAAAASVGVVSLGIIDNGQAQTRMKIAGTSPKYTGLYGCVAVAEPVDQAAIDAASNEFPQVHQTTGLVQSMVEIDHIFAHLREIEKAGWTVPANHPDLVPVAEAGRMADLFRNLMEDEEVKSQPADYLQWMKQSSADASALEEALLENASRERLSAILAQIDTTCSACHAKYRNQ